VIFAEHLNPAWQRNYENLGSEPWRNDWLINWRQEYIDLYTTTFEVPEWKGEPNSEPPVWQVKIDFDVEQGEMSREAEAMTHSQSRQTPK
jgi:hypothetical protein